MFVGAYVYVCVCVSGGFFDPYKDTEAAGCQTRADEVRGSSQARTHTVEVLVSIN